MRPIPLLEMSELRPHGDSDVSDLGLRQICPALSQHVLLGTGAEWLRIYSDFLSPLLTLLPVFLHHTSTKASSSQHLIAETPPLVHFSLFIWTIMVHKVSIRLLRVVILMDLYA